MGLFDKIRNEFVDIIDWKDETGDTLVWRFPRYQDEIKYGAKLTVRESQAAVFLNEGKIADVFGPGMYTLETQNMPILATLKGWKYGFNSPFKADVFFVSTRQFTDQKWGTKNPVTLDDDRFGFIELRAFGNYSFRVSDAGLFLKEIAGTSGRFTTEEINGQLRTLVVTKFSDAIGEGNIPVEKFAANLEELSQLGREKLNDRFTAYGLEITDFLVENVSMPEELKKEIFEYSRLNKIDMAKLTQMKAAKAIEASADNPGGLMGAGMGAGMGMAMGGMMSGMMQQNMQGQQNQQNPPPLPNQAIWFVAVNGQQQGPFDNGVLSGMAAQGQITRESLVWKTGMGAWTPAGQIPELATIFANVPPPLA
ncbi:MAG: SPFH domain-containing protein [Bacteroidia bacterium]|nr:SPFH domain-containing protein [Bacteroidia bacterium]